MILFRLLALCLLVCSPAIGQSQIKSGVQPGSYLLGSDVLTVAADGTITLAKSPLTLSPLSVTPVPPGPGPTPGPGPAPTPVLNARAQAVLDSANAITTDPDKAKTAAGFVKLLTETKKMLVAANVGDATIIGKTLKFALDNTIFTIPNGAAWKPTADLIGLQFNEQQRSNANAVLTVFDDAIAGLTVAANGIVLELPWVVDPKTGKAAIDEGGKEISNPRYTPMAVTPGAIDWVTLFKTLLPLILQILSMFMS